jgi:hypothetical protein
MAISNSGSVGRGRAFVEVQHPSAKSRGGNQLAVVRFASEGERRGAKLPASRQPMPGKSDASGFGASVGAVE